MNSKLLAGLGALLLWSLICIGCHGHQFGFPDASAVQAKLQSIGFPKIGATAHEGNVTLTGTVPAEEDKQRIETEVKAMEGVKAVNNQIVVDNSPSPFLARLAKKGDGIILRGTLPSQEVKDGVVAAATERWGEGKVTDELKVEKGNFSPKLLDSIKGYFPRIQELQGGKLVASNEEFHLYGRSPDPALSKTVYAEQQPNLPEDTKLGVHIGAPWTKENMMGIARSYGDKVVLSGVVPDWDTHDQILDMANKQYGEDKVVDRMSVAEIEATPAIGEAFSKLFPEIKDLEGGQLAATPEDATISGYLKPDGEKATSLKEKLSALWPGLKYNFAPKLAMGECQDAVNAAMSKGKIEFEVDSDLIKPSSNALLRTIAGTLKRCPDSKLEIQGHTDSDGDEAYNQDLSQRRAESVKQRLLGLGMPVDRASTMGYGETKPIADNGTEEGKQKNRRIEFQLKGSEN